MLDVISAKASEWGIKKGLEVIWNGCKNFLNGRKKKKAIKNAWKLAVAKAEKDYPSLASAIGDPSFSKLFDPVTQTYLEATQPTEFEQIRKGLANSIVERWKVTESDAEGFVHKYCEYLEAAVRKNLKEEALLRDAARAADDAEKVRDKLMPSEADISQHIEKLHSAAETDLERCKKSLKTPEAPVFLGIERIEDDKRGSLDVDEVSCLISEGKNIIIEAGPGCGKTTTLTQFGKTLLDARDCIPIFIPLLDISSGETISGVLIKREAFSSVGDAKIRLVAKAGKLALLCDGWNELSAKQRSPAWQALKQFSSDFPECSIVLATRAQSNNPPLEKAATLYLSRLSNAQQLEIIQAELGEGGVELLERVRMIPGLRDVLRIPFYLRAIATLGSIKSFPENKGEIIDGFVTKHVEPYERNQALQNIFAGEHDIYLRQLAYSLVAASTIAITENEIRTVFSDTSSQLLSKKQIKNEPDPHVVAETLVAHHILIQQGTGDTALYSFQHHQFQEWYASFYAEKLIIDAAEDIVDAQATLYESVINYVVWEEPVLFAVERLSRKSKKGAQAVGKLVLKTLGIDPMLAADILSRSDKKVWDYVKKDTISFIKAWHKDGEKDRSVDFMLLSGQSDFAPDLWKLIEQFNADDNNIRLRQVGYFDPIVLGEDAIEKMLSLKPEVRQSLLWDIIYAGEYGGMEFAKELIKQEPNLEVFMSIWDGLRLYSLKESSAELFENAPDGILEEFTKYRRWKKLPDNDFKEKVIKKKTELIETLPLSHERILQILDLTEIGVKDYSEQLVSEVLETKFSDNTAEYHILKDVAELYPKKLSQAIIQSVLDGHEINYSAFDFLLPDTAVDQAALIEAIETPSNKPSFKKAVVKLLSTESIKGILEEIIVTKEKATKLERNQATALWDSYRNQTGVLGNVVLERLIIAILQIDATEPAHIAEFSKILSSWGDTYTRQATLELSIENEAALVERAQEWSEIILNHPDATRSNIAAIASLLGCLGDPKLLTLLKQLLDKELELYKDYKRIADETDGGWINVAEDIKHELSDKTPTCQYFRQAFEGFNCPEMVEIVIEYLNEREFRVSAAFVLLHFVQKRSGIEVKPLSSTDYSKVSEKRAELLSTERSTEVDPIVTNIINCAETLLQGDDKSQAHASKLAIAAAQMQYGASIESFLNVLQSTAPIKHRVTLAQILIQNGEEIPVDHILSIIKETEIEFLGNEWEQNNNWYRMKEVIDLLAFTDQSDLMLGYFSKYRNKHYQQAWQLRHFLNVLCHSTDPEKAVDMLRELQNVVPDLLSEYEWGNALGYIGTKKAAELLVELIFDTKKLNLIKNSSWRIREIFRKLIYDHPDVREDLLQRLSAKNAVSQRHFVAGMAGFHGGMEEDLFLVIFKSSPPTEKETFHLLESSIEDLAIERQPIEGSNGMSNLEPNDISSLRAELFHNITSDSPLKDMAIEMLNRIDCVRDEYGRPPSEPKHPNIKSGKAYPLEAQDTWDTNK